MFDAYKRYLYRNRKEKERKELKSYYDGKFRLMSDDEYRRFTV